LITTTIGFIVAYDPVTAIHKFYLIVGAVLLFLSLAHQPKENIGIIASTLSIVGAITTIIFVLITDWSTFPADFGFINSFGNWVTKNLPQANFRKIFSLQLFPANMVGGINAILIPVALATSVYYAQKKQKFQTILTLLVLLFLFLGLIISSSRAAWVSVFVSLSFAIILFSAQKKFSFEINRFLYPAIPFIIILLGIFLPLLLATSISETPISLSAVTSFDSRLKLAGQTFFLIADFPFTGGGLGSFPGLYSQYILVIPYFMFGYSHNLYLDLALEQGIFGFLIWVLIVLACAITLGSSTRKLSFNKSLGLFSFALYASLLTWLLHGILDDPVYSGSWGLMFLFVIPGLAAIFTHQHHFSFQGTKRYWKFALLGLSAFVITLIFFINPITSSWQANIGAVHMANIELVNFPSGEWTSENQADRFIKPASYFTKSLSQNPKEVTAHYRLGLILMSDYGFQKAAEHLELALGASPEHRGIRKNLGYCYTWLGEFDKAELLLEQIPEAKTEMETFVWWWQTQNQNNLAKNAAEMSILLSHSNIPGN